LGGATDEDAGATIGFGEADAIHALLQADFVGDAGASVKQEVDPPFRRTDVRHAIPPPALPSSRSCEVDEGPQSSSRGLHPPAPASSGSDREFSRFGQGEETATAGLGEALLHAALGASAATQTAG